jgi:hypothetical protein
MRQWELPEEMEKRIEKAADFTLTTQVEKN